MAASTGVYAADDLSNPGVGAPDSSWIGRTFKVTVANALAQTGAAKWLIGDIILLAPLPPQCKFFRYRIAMPNLDSGSGATFDVGDTQVLAGAPTAITSGAVALPALGVPFTLTATASTAAFTATNGLLSVANGLIVNYESLSGNTFVNCRTFVTGSVIPNGAQIQQLGNTAAYQAASTAGGLNLAGIMTPDYSISAANAIVTGTPVAGALPVLMPPAFQTAALRIGVTGPTYGNIQPYYFLIRVHATVTTAVTTGVITGQVEYYMTGY